MAKTSGGNRGGAIPAGWSMTRARQIEAQVFARRNEAEKTARNLSDKDLLFMRERLAEQDKGPNRSLRAALTYKTKTFGAGAMRERLIRESAQQRISRMIVEEEIRRRKIKI